MKITEEWVDVSHSIGVPFGAIGTGYGVYGKYGFIHPNFGYTPNEDMYKDYTDIAVYDYTNVHGKYRKNFMKVNMEIGGEKYTFQGESLDESSSNTADTFKTYAFLPFSKYEMDFLKPGINVEILGYTPLIPYNLKESSTPVFVLEISLCNICRNKVEGILSIDTMDLDDSVCVEFDLGKKFNFALEPEEKCMCKMYISWYYPQFKTPSPVLTEEYTRYYTLNFKSAKEIVDYAKENCDLWKAKEIEWHNSLNVPAPFKRMWFSSLSSVITSTMLSDTLQLFEIESPHYWINTMDVTIYSHWIYMINWPEIEKMDMYNYRNAIKTDGKDKGLVWHSLWSDGAHYVEEPCFITRIYRDYLWYNDKKFLLDMSETLQNALNRVYESQYDGLIESLEGNQSYDLWKMPGVCTYVNIPWVTALYSIVKINKAIGADINLGGVSITDALENAKKSLIKYLWNDKYGYFNAFYRTPDADDVSVEETVFTDQFFGLWLLLIERGGDELISMDMVEKSLNHIYNNNLINDEKNGFRGWVNGMLNGKKPCCDDEQYHVKTCWLGAQLDLASLLGSLGYENESLDVFYSVEKSLKNNHLAVGEWNKSITENGMSEPLSLEISKDTPRFPAYPRYKCSWEYLIRMLGLKIDEKYFELNPFKSLDFSVTDICLAGCRISVSVEKGWNKIIVDGKTCDKAIMDRNQNHTVKFII